MDRFRPTVLVLDGILATAAVAISAMWAMDILNLPDFEHVARVANSLRAGDVSLGRILVILVGLTVFVMNVLLLLSPILFGKYDGYIRWQTNDGEVSLSVPAAEEDLARAVQLLPTIRDVRVSVYKERKSDEKPIRIFVSCATSEGTRVTDLTEKVREVVKLRLQELVEIHQAPTLQVCVGRIERTEVKKPAPTKPKKEKEPFESFKGPEYPVDAENESVG